MRRIITTTIAASLIFLTGCGAASVIVGATAIGSIGGNNSTSVASIVVALINKALGIGTK